MYYRVIHKFKWRGWEVSEIVAAMYRAVWVDIGGDDHQDLQGDPKV